ncbi:MAG: GNAT family N-acetyltransferase [Lutibacter sp.]|nr:MAG: GNAT family N-acetyltransferase [Lutibacter sp.]
MMITIVRTDFKNKDFIELVNALNTFLKVADGEDHDFYNQYNNIDVLNQVVVVYKGGIPLGCGAIKKYDDESIEIKRMFVSSESRRMGVAIEILKELELWSKELGFKKCILETGIGLKNAISLYQTNGYKSIPNYGQYENAENSVCFEKHLE